MEIKYEEIARFYLNIIHYIFETIQKEAPMEWDDKTNTPVHSKDYLIADGYFEKALWRLHSVLEMKDYYDEEHFEDFGLENLSDARHRIEHFLENGDRTISFDNERIVLNYTHYDDVIIDYYRPIRMDKNVHHDYFMYYQKISYRDSDISNIKSDLEAIKGELEMFEYRVGDSDYLVNKSAIKSIIKEINDSLNKIEIEQVEITKEDSR